MGARWIERSRNVLSGSFVDHSRTPTTRLMICLQRMIEWPCVRPIEPRIVENSKVLPPQIGRSNLPRW